MTPAPGAPQPPGAKTIPLAKAPSPGGAAPAPVGAKTIPLAKAPRPGGPALGRQTTPLGQPGGAKPLPQATVKLQQTQPMTKVGASGAIPASPNIRSTAVNDEEDWEEEYEESGLVAFSWVVLVLALAVLGVTLYTYSLTA